MVEFRVFGPAKVGRAQGLSAVTPPLSALGVNTAAHGRPSGL
jgi:hypothetical protein